MSEVGWFRDFEFDLQASLLRDLTVLFDEMPHGSLSIEEAGKLPEAQGVYQLFLDEALVYVGKTDSKAGLNKRLLRHANKIRYRHNLDPSRVSFKAVRIFVFTPMDLEQGLIDLYAEEGQKPAWNHSGFGANDPGRERDTSKFKDGHFDRDYPIDIDRPTGLSFKEGQQPVSMILEKLKRELPYLLRYQNAGGSSRKPHPDLASTLMEIPNGTHTVRDVLQMVKFALGHEWQLTVLPGYIIAYRENKRYPAGALID